MGRCVFCSESVDNGYPLKVIPRTFTAWQWLQAGSCICERCYNFLKTPAVRRNSWIIRGNEMTVDRIEFLEKPLQTLLNPPDPPFRLYLTKQRRKHGWIRLIHNPALNRSFFLIAFEEDLIRIDLHTATKMHKHALLLLEKGLSKKDLLHGVSASTFNSLCEIPGSFEEIKMKILSFQFSL